MFVLWNIYTISYSAYPNQGWMMVLKFSLPYLYFWLGYNAITCKDDFYAFLKRTCWICCIYALIIGGVSAKFITPLYNILNFTSDRLFISYASLADFFAILIPLPLVMYFATKEKKYLFMAGWLFLSTLLESVRTGIGACVLGLCAFYVAYRKWAAIPHVFMGVVLLIVSLFAIPEVREKMFIVDSDNVTVGTVSLDNVEMNGRENMWEMIMDHCYKGHETYGSGCGAALGWLKTEVKDDVMQLIHSDWVQMISESGNVGLGLFVFFVIAMLFKILGTIWRGKQSQTVVFAGSITIASFFACFFAMGFDNVVTYAQQGYVLPFIFLGIFYKAIDIKL